MGFIRLCATFLKIDVRGDSMLPTPFAGKAHMMFIVRKCQVNPLVEHVSDLWPNMSIGCKDNFQ